MTSKSWEDDPHDPRWSEIVSGYATVNGELKPITYVITPRMERAKYLTVETVLQQKVRRHHERVTIQRFVLAVAVVLMLACAVAGYMVLR